MNDDDGGATFAAARPKLRGLDIGVYAVASEWCTATW
jgi:hypothetical protein